MRLRVASSVPLAGRPLLGRCVLPAGAGGLGEDGLQGVRQGDVLNVVNTTPDGTLAYCILGGGPGSREGWVPAEAVQVLEPVEAAQVPEEARLTTREILQRITLVSVDEYWQDPDDGSTLGLRCGEVLQLSAVKDGWAFGWPPENPTRRGWFPLGLVHKVDSTLASLVKPEDEELSLCASAALVELLKERPPPPPQQWLWEGELPALVADSAQHEEREWRESLARMEDSRAKADSGDADEEPEGPEGAAACASADAPTAKAFSWESCPEDSWPLVVCKSKFVPPKGNSGVLLQLLVGDLVRVTSDIKSELNASMFYGFLDGRSSVRGWFPKRNVQLVEDPDSQDQVPLEPEPLPKVPAGLLQRRFGQ